MRPVRLDLHNFLAYRDSGEISFEGLDIACLCGPNGAGKSSLLDALTWAIWGRARIPGNRSDDMLIHLGEDDMTVVLDFLQDDQRYRIKREHKRGKISRGTVALWHWREEEGWASLTEAKSDTQDKINKLLRLDYDTFVDSAFVRQGKADSFTSKSPTDRKKLLVEILGLKRWEGYETQAKVKLSAVATEIATIEALIKASLKEESEEGEFVIKRDAARAKWDDLQASVTAAELEYEAFAGAEQELKSAGGQRDGIDRRIKERERDLKTIKDELTAQQTRLSKLQQTLANQTEIEAGYAQLADARRAFDEIDEQFRQHTAVEKQINTLNHQISAARAKLESDHARHMDKITELKAEIDQMPRLRAELAALDEKLAGLGPLTERKAQLQAESQTQFEEISALKAANDQLRLQMQEIKVTLDKLGSTAGAICPTCGQALTGSHQEELTAAGKRLGDTFRGNKTRVDELERQRVEHQTLLADCERELKAFERHTVNRGIQAERVSQIEKHAERLDAERNAAAEIKMTLDFENYGHEFREALTESHVQLEQIGYQAETHAAIREAIKTFRPFDQQMSDLRVALESVADLENRLIDTQSRLERMTLQLADERQELVAINETIKLLVSKAQEALELKRTRDRLIEQERDARDKFSRLEQQLSAIESSRQRRLELEGQQNTLHDEAAIYKELIDAFGKNGVPALMIDAAIPELEEQTNRLLFRMTNGRMNIRFDTQRTNKGGETVETLDILISDELGQRIYDLYSGGEGFRINFALRIALSQFLAHRAGARLQTLVIDEGFGSQDAEGRERIVEAINAVKDDFDLILIVTHIEELIDMFPARIEVKKTANGSQVAIR